MLIRHDHGMTGAVRVCIQDHKAMLATMHDQGLRVVRLPLCIAKYASFSLVGIGYVGVSPRSEEIVHDEFVNCNWK